MFSTRMGGSTLACNSSREFGFGYITYVTSGPALEEIMTMIFP